MRLREASFEGFRNLAPARLGLSPVANVFLGGNGQGKSNLLEALNYPALGRSHRGARDEDLVAFGGEAARVCVSTAIEGGGDLVFEYALGRAGERRVRVDGEPVARRADLVGRLASVVFDPPSVLIAGGPPELRRRFADQGLSVLDPGCLVRLVACHRAVRQKAALLRDARRAGRPSGRVREELAAWNRELAGQAGPLCESRAEWAGAMAPRAASAYAELDPASPCMSLSYVPSMEACRRGLAGQELVQEILQELDYIAPEEVRRGRVLSGPHLDDYELLLGGVSLRGFGSRGEARSAALALKLALGELIFEQRRVRPVLIFDDVFSELDKGRAHRLQERCAADHQLIIATARPDDVAGWRPAELRTWRVDGGRLEETT